MNRKKVALTCGGH